MGALVFLLMSFLCVGLVLPQANAEHNPVRLWLPWGGVPKSQESGFVSIPHKIGISHKSVNPENSGPSINKQPLFLRQIQRIGPWEPGRGLWFDIERKPYKLGVLVLRLFWQKLSYFVIDNYFLYGGYGAADIFVTKEYFIQTMKIPARDRVVSLYGSPSAIK